MLNVKSAYIQGLLVTMAVFGLINCDKKTNNAPLVQQQDNGDGTNGGDHQDEESLGFSDPTLIETRETPIEEFTSYSPLSSSKAANFTGFDLDTNLKFTDASANESAVESHLAKLKRQIRQEANGDSDLLAANKAFAESLSLTQVILNANDPSDVRVNFKIKRDSKEINYSMVGKIQAIQSKYSKNLTAQLKPASGPQDIVLNLQCLDEEETCHNSLLIFNDKSTQEIRKAFALFRTTPVKLQFYIQSSGLNSNTGFIGNDNSLDLPLTLVSSTAFSLYSDLLSNSLRRHNQHKRIPYIQSSVLETSSVVFGRSQFALYSRINNENEKSTILPIMGPLVRPRHDSTVNQELPSPTSILLKNPALSPIDKIARGVSDFTLIENDGNGTLQILLNFGADQQQSDLVILTISRLSVQLRALND